MEVEVGIDTGPGTQPRSYEYNNEGMLLEGWKKTGGPIFGCTWFRKSVVTYKEARTLKAEKKAACEELYADGAIRGAQFDIIRPEPSE